MTAAKISGDARLATRTFGDIAARVETRSTSWGVGGCSAGGTKAAMSELAVQLGVARTSGLSVTASGSVTATEGTEAVTAGDSMPKARDLSSTGSMWASTIQLGMRWMRGDSCAVTGFSFLGVTGGAETKARGAAG